MCSARFPNRASVTTLLLVTSVVYVLHAHGVQIILDIDESYSKMAFIDLLGSLTGLIVLLWDREKHMIVGARRLSHPRGWFELPYLRS